MCRIPGVHAVGRKRAGSVGIVKVCSFLYDEETKCYCAVAEDEELTDAFVIEIIEASEKF